MCAVCAPGAHGSEKRTMNSRSLSHAYLVGTKTKPGSSAKAAAEPSLQPPSPTFPECVSILGPQGKLTCAIPAHKPGDCTDDSWLPDCAHTHLTPEDLGGIRAQVAVILPPQLIPGRLLQKDATPKRLGRVRYGLVSHVTGGVVRDYPGCCPGRRERRKDGAAKMLEDARNGAQQLSWGLRRPRVGVSASSVPSRCLTLVTHPWCWCVYRLCHHPDYIMLRQGLPRCPWLA